MRSLRYLSPAFADCLLVLDLWGISASKLASLLITGMWLISGQLIHLKSELNVEKEEGNNKRNPAC